MNKTHCGIGIGLALAGSAAFAPVAAQVAPPTASPAAVSDEPAVTDAPRIGRIHEALQRRAQRDTARQWLKDEYTEYLTWKDALAKSTGFQYTLGLSLLQQWGFSGGGSPSLQIFATPSINWELGTHPTWGSGSVQVAYNAVPTYPTSQDANMISARLGLISPINDFGSKFLQFAQFTYTHTSPGNAVSVGVGQYPFYNFDGNEFLANQQLNFNALIFSQNGAATYPLSGWGAFGQWNITPSVQIAAGLQSAADPSGQTLSTSGFGDDGFAWLAYAQWTPKLTGLGAAQYSVTWFSTPEIPTQGASEVWSLNAVQHLNEHWAVFGRANRASGYTTAIRGSWVLGVARNDPLGRNPADQIGFAIGRSEAASPPTNPVGARNETAAEVYWNWSLAGGLVVLSPSAQMFLDPALDPSRDHAWSLGMRATFQF